MQRRLIATVLLIGSISGCVSTGEPETGGQRPNYGRSFGPPAVPGVMGPYGQSVPMAPPYNSAPPGRMAAANMLNNSMSMSMLNMHPTGLITPPNVQGMPGSMPMPGVPGPGGMPGPGMPPGAGNPLQKTSMSGMMPDAGVMNANIPPGMRGPGGVTNAQFANAPSGPLFPAQRTQVFFTKPAGMKIYWIAQGADGKPATSTTPLETPGRYNFAQAAIYRLKLEKIPGRPGVDLYPTLEVVPTSPKTNEFLAHNSVPVEFTEDDFKQVFDRNYIVKVIYLPDPQFQDAAGLGPDEIVSTRLEPGQDPIQEALRRGSILLVLRMGNIDQGLQHSPSMTAPAPGGPPMMMKPPGLGVPPLFQVPHPTPSIAPGVGSIPNPLPPLPGGNPPLVILPKLPTAPGGKLEPAPDPNEKKGENLVVPNFTLPAPPGSIGNEGAKPIPEIPLPPKVQPNGVNPALPPAPSPLDKNDKGVTGPSVQPNLPLTPTSSSQESGPQLPSMTLPALPSADSSPASRSDLPPLPMGPGGRR